MDHPLVIQTGKTLGDTFQVIYITDLTTPATDSNASFYHAVVQTDAANQGFGGINWKAVVATVNDPLGPTNTPQLAEIVLSDGTHFRNLASLYAPSNPGSPGMLDMSGSPVADPDDAWSGMDSFTGEGVTVASAGALGLSSAYAGDPAVTTNSAWFLARILTTTQTHRLYGLSESLTVIPEPTTFVLAALDILGIVWCRRKRR